MSTRESETQEVIDSFNQPKEGWFDFCAKMRKILTSLNRRLGEAENQDDKQPGDDVETKIAFDGLGTYTRAEGDPPTFYSPDIPAESGDRNLDTAGETAPSMSSKCGPLS